MACPGQGSRCRERRLSHGSRWNMFQAPTLGKCRSSLRLSRRFDRSSDARFGHRRSRSRFLRRPRCRRPRSLFRSPLRRSASLTLVDDALVICGSRWCRVRFAASLGPKSIEACRAERPYWRTGLPSPAGRRDLSPSCCRPGSRHVVTTRPHDQKTVRPRTPGAPLVGSRYSTRLCVAVPAPSASAELIIYGTPSL